MSAPCGRSGSGQNGSARSRRMGFFPPFCLVPGVVCGAGGQSRQRRAGLCRRLTVQGVLPRLMRVAGGLFGWLGVRGRRRRAHGWRGQIGFGRPWLRAHGLLPAGFQVASSRLVVGNDGAGRRSRDRRISAGRPRQVGLEVRQEAQRGAGSRRIGFCCARIAIGVVWWPVSALVVSVLLGRGLFMHVLGRLILPRQADLVLCQPPSPRALAVQPSTQCAGSQRHSPPIAFHQPGCQFGPCPSAGTHCPVCQT